MFHYDTKRPHAFLYTTLVLITHALIGYYENALAILLKIVPKDYKKEWQGIVSSKLKGLDLSSYSTTWHDFHIFRNIETRIKCINCSLKVQVLKFEHCFPTFSKLI